MTRPIRAVIFDMDGLMIDSENIYTVVTNELLAPYGKEMTWAIKAGIMGRPAPDAARYLIEATGIPLSPDELITQTEGKLVSAFRAVQPLPGVERLVSHLVAHNIPIAIATGSKAKNYDIKTAHLQSLFAPFVTGVNLICGDDPILLGRGKPDPTIFLVAGKMIGFETDLERGSVLVFEDGAPGVRAAKAAGMQCVWIPDGELVKVMGDDHDLSPGATLASMDEFVPEEWGLPPY